MNNFFIWTMSLTEDKELMFELKITDNLIFYIKQEKPSGYWKISYINKLKSDKINYVYANYETEEQARDNCEKLITNMLEEELGE